MHCKNSVKLIRFKGFNWLPQTHSCSERIHNWWLCVFAGKVESDRIEKEGFDESSRQNRRREEKWFIFDAKRVFCLWVVQRHCPFFFVSSIYFGFECSMVTWFYRCEGLEGYKEFDEIWGLKLQRVWWDW